jgi:prevent-host-death family protein
MKHVTITEAEAQFDKLVAEVEQTGDEVVITRNGAPVARLVQATAELSPEEIEKRKTAIRNLRTLARELKIGATQEDIKEWINEGRH